MKQNELSKSKLIINILIQVLYFISQKKKNKQDKNL